MVLTNARPALTKCRPVSIRLYLVSTSLDSVSKCLEQFRLVTICLDSVVTFTFSLNLSISADSTHLYISGNLVFGSNYTKIFKY